MPETHESSVDLFTCASRAPSPLFGLLSFMASRASIGKPFVGATMYTDFAGS